MIFIRINGSESVYYVHTFFLNLLQYWSVVNLHKWGKLVITIIFILILFLLPIQKNSSTNTIKRITTLENIKEIQMYGEKGWLLKSNNQLMHTHNGIENFYKVNIPEIFINDSEIIIYPYDDSTCYLLSYYESQIIIASTFDCGETWEKASIPAEFGNYGTYLSMINSKEGYLLYCSGSSPIMLKLYYTEDGGKSFNFYSDITNINSYVKDFYVSEGGISYIVVDFRGNVRNTTMFESTDLSNWTECEFNLDSNKTHYINDAPAFTDQNNGYMFLTEKNSLNKIFFFKTTNGGKQWDEYDKIYRTTELVNMSINAKSKELYLIDSNGSVYITNIK